MPEPKPTPDLVRERLAARLAAPPPTGGLSDDAPLGEGGLGLDSIAVVELLLDFEERWGISAQPLIEGPAPRVADVVGHFSPG